jgi:hypothetical protein
MKSLLAIVASVFALTAVAQTAPAKKEEAKPAATAPAVKKDAQPAKSEAKTAPAKDAKAAK